MGVLYYRDPATGTYKPLGGGGGGSEEVWVGPDEPYQNEDLWFDTDAEGAPPYDWQDADSRYVNVTGDTMSGTLALADATADTHAVNRRTADARYRLSGSQLRGSLASPPQGSYQKVPFTSIEDSWGTAGSISGGSFVVPVTGVWVPALVVTATVPGDAWQYSVPWVPGKATAGQTLFFEFFHWHTEVYGSAPIQMWTTRGTSGMANQQSAEFGVPSGSAPTGVEIFSAVYQVA